MTHTDNINATEFPTAANLLISIRMQTLKILEQFQNPKTIETKDGSICAEIYFNDALPVEYVNRLYRNLDHIFQSKLPTASIVIKPLFTPNREDIIGLTFTFPSGQAYQLFQYQLPSMTIEYRQEIVSRGQQMPSAAKVTGSSQYAYKDAMRLIEILKTKSAEDILYNDKGLGCLKIQLSGVALSDDVPHVVALAADAIETAGLNNLNLYYQTVDENGTPAYPASYFVHLGDKNYAPENLKALQYYLDPSKKLLVDWLELEKRFDQMPERHIKRKFIEATFAKEVQALCLMLLNSLISNTTEIWSDDELATNIQNLQYSGSDWLIFDAKHLPPELVDEALRILNDSINHLAKTRKEMPHFTGRLAAIPYEDEENLERLFALGVDEGFAEDAREWLFVHYDELADLIRASVHGVPIDKGSIQLN